MSDTFRDPSTLKAIRKGTGESLRVFGQTLKKALDPTDPKGFDKSYIIQLENGKRPCTPALEAAYRRIAAALDDTDPAIATSREVTVYAVHDISGALVTGKAQKCARPGCPVRFVPHNPLQKYHSAECRAENAAQHKARANPAPGPFLGTIQWKTETNHE